MTDGSWSIGAEGQKYYKQSIDSVALIVRGPPIKITNTKDYKNNEMISSNFYLDCEQKISRQAFRLSSPVLNSSWIL